MPVTTTTYRDNYVNVQSVTDDETEVTRLVAREIPTTRQQSRFEDYVNTTSYDTPFQAVADKYQTVTRQRTTRHPHAARVPGVVDGAKSYGGPTAPGNNRAYARAYGHHGY